MWQIETRLILISYVHQSISFELFILEEQTVLYSASSFKMFLYFHEKEKRLYHIANYRCENTDSKSFGPIWSRFQCGYTLLKVLNLLLCSNFPFFCYPSHSSIRSLFELLWHFSIARPAGVEVVPIMAGVQS